MWYPNVVIPQESRLAESKLDLLQGTLDLMVPQTLAAMGSPIAGLRRCERRIEQVSGDNVLLNQGTIYASLVRLQQRGWISAGVGNFVQQPKGQFYSNTKRGATSLRRMPHCA